MNKKAISVDDLNKIKGVVAQITYPDNLGKNIIITKKIQKCLANLMQELEDERHARTLAYDLLAVREIEILELRKQIRH